MWVLGGPKYATRRPNPECQLITFAESVPLLPLPSCSPVLCHSNCSRPKVGSKWALPVARQLARPVARQRPSQHHCNLEENIIARINALRWEAIFERRADCLCFETTFDRLPAGLCKHSRPSHQHQGQARRLPRRGRDSLDALRVSPRLTPRAEEERKRNVFKGAPQARESKEQRHFSLFCTIFLVEYGTGCCSFH